MVKQGNILLAEPFMDEPTFKKAAIFITDYPDSGTVGFIINKPIHMKLNNVLASFPEFDADVYFGGPVGTDTVHYLHTFGDLLEESLHVGEGIYWGGNYEKLKFLVKQELVKPYQIKFLIGYAGWSKGQLEDEINAGSWIVSELDKNYIFSNKVSNLWKQMMQDRGATWEIMSDLTDDVNWN